MQRFYPYCEIPRRIAEIEKGEGILPKEPKAPVIPKKPDEVKFNPLVLIYLIGGIIILMSTNHAIIGIILLGLFIIALIMFSNEKSKYENLLNAYSSNKVKYEKESQGYLILSKDYLSFLEKLKDDKYLSDYKNKLFVEYFKSTITFKIDNVNKKGKAEQFFYRYLLKYFINEIFVNKAIEKFETKYKEVSVRKYIDNNPEFYDPVLYEYGGTFSETKEYNPYCPDFIFKHSKTNLHIDIEIDEPYSSNKPIHYLGNKSDAERNDYFLGKGWLVIRFSEEQVVRNSECCCFFIASVINKYTDDNSYMLKFSSPLQLESSKIWTKEDALLMINSKFRDTYLSRLIE